MDGRHSLLIDPGAWSNLVGEKSAIEMDLKAITAGHLSTEEKLTRPFKAKGIGLGTNTAEWEVTIPIAVAEGDRNTLLHSYTALIVGESGSDLPALLGLKSLSSHRAILEMTPGEEYLTLPGPGGYTMNWSPGTRRYKL